MLERIKKCRSQYQFSEKKRVQVAEKLAEGLVRRRGKKEGRNHSLVANTIDKTLEESTASFQDQTEKNFQGEALNLNIPKVRPLSTFDQQSSIRSLSHYRPSLPSIFTPSSHRILDLQEHKILKTLAKPYELSKYRNFYEKMEQVHGLP